jgi:hypothetical protein
VDAEQILAFRLVRSGLARRAAGSFAEAAACPASDFSRDAAMLALAARHEGFSREQYDAAVDSGELVVAHAPRGAIHALAPGDVALYGHALVATDGDELTAQLGEQVRRLVAEGAFRAVAGLAEVAGSIREALDGGRALTKNELHDSLRGLVRQELLPWCEGCKSNHVAPMVWRYGTVEAAARLDSGRRYLLDPPGAAPAAAEAVRRFLHFYGPATPDDFEAWAGLAKPHARRLWQEVEGELTQVDGGSILRDDEAELGSPPAATGVRLIPPGDPYLSLPNRPLLAPDKELRKRLFRPVGSPGAVLKDGALVGLWRVKAKRKEAEITVEKLGRIARADIEEEAQRIADLRGASGLALALD